jgi:adenosylhomocysteine nucleosidase
MKHAALDEKSPIAILSALAEEQYGLIELLQNPEKTTHASRDFWQGELHGHSVVLALSKIGKVAAATTATTLIERFGVGCLVFTGVAGGLAPGVNVGDVVVGQEFMQHDIDASPLFKRFEVPLYGTTRFASDPVLTGQLLQAARSALAQPELRHIYPAAVTHTGLIASGDRFVSGVAESGALRDALLADGHHALAVEMEGAAVAQVCADYALPFAVVRTVSDRADDSAHVDFPGFIEQVASRYTFAIVESFLRLL